MKLITLYLPVPWIGMLDEVVETGVVANRANAIREAIRDYLKDHDVWRKVDVEEEAWKQIEVAERNIRRYHPKRGERPNMKPMTGLGISPDLLKEMGRNE